MRVFAYMPIPRGLTGAPRRLLTLASALRNEGTEMCIATQRGSDLFRAAEELGLETAGVDPVGVLGRRHGALFGGGVVFRLKVLLSLLVQNVGIATSIRKHRANVVWIRGSKGIAFAALGALLSRRPLVWDVDYELPSRGVMRWLHRLGLWMSKAVVFQYAAAPYEIFGEQLANRYAAKYEAIIPGIDLPKLEKHRVARGNRENNLGDPFVILQVGTICDRKNQALMIEALDRLQLNTSVDGIRLRLAGGVFEEAYAEQLRRRIEERGLGGMVEWLGWRDDIHDLMVQADLLVMPSRDEGVPNTVQEAMYIGLPVVVCEAGGMPEIVRDGESGWVLPIDNPQAWAARIEQCARKRGVCEEVGFAGSASAINFGMSKWGARYSAVLKQVMRRA